MSDCLKLENNLCRCCHAEGTFKTLGVTFETQGREIYADMLRDYLDINLDPVPGPLCLVTYTICEECVQRLHDAVDFKKQILECEERFRDMYRRDIIKVCQPAEVEGIKVEVDIPDIPSTYVEALKFETVPVESIMQDDSDCEFPEGVEPETTVFIEPVTDVEEKKKEKGKGKAKAPKSPKKTSTKKSSTILTEKQAEKKTSVRKSGVKKTTKKGLRELKKYINSFNEVKGKQRYACKRCPVKYSKWDSMKRHLDNWHLNPPKKCPICDDEFRDPRLREEHVIIKHGLEIYFDCDSNSNKLRPATNHVCDVCAKEFQLKRSLREHVRLMHMEFKCPECEILLCKRELLIHRNEVHGVHVPKCGICGYRSHSQCKVNMHQKQVHMKEKNFKCELCDMKFFTIGMIQRHMIRHNPKKIFNCTYCEKKFARIATLRQHLMIHTGEKRKVCSICGDRFVQKASLNYHMLKRHPETC